MPLALKIGVKLSVNMMNILKVEKSIIKLKINIQKVKSSIWNGKIIWLKIKIVILIVKMI